MQFPRREKILPGIKAEGHYGRSGWSRKHKKLVRSVLKDISNYLNKDCRRLLDVGTGPGNLLEALRDHIGSEYSAYGADVDVEMIPLMKGVLEKDHQRKGFVINDNQRLPFKANTFQLIVSVLALHHFMHPAEMILEMNRILDPNGKILIYDFDPESVKLRFYCFIFKVYNFFAKSIAMRGFLESVEVSYPKQAMAELMKTAGINSFQIYNAGFFNVLAIEK
jgi:ubiquinone/menaquinone biosynthesis C-methylase UbiE